MGIGGMGMYAVNLSDLTGIRQGHPEHMALLVVLDPLLDTDQVIECEYGKAVGMGYAVPFTCPDERAAALTKVIRKRLKKHELRIYHKEGGSWKRV